jgi:hypothetical protein
MYSLARILLCCLVLSAVDALPPKAEILADGLNAVNYWRASYEHYCGWEDATLMIGELAGQQRQQQQQHSQCLCTADMHSVHEDCRPLLHQRPVCLAYNCHNACNPSRWIIRMRCMPYSVNHQTSVCKQMLTAVVLYCFNHFRNSTAAGDPLMMHYT